MKVLIFMSESDLKPTGWPNWYLYNLNEGLSKINDEDVEISFLPKIDEWREHWLISKIKSFILKLGSKYSYIWKIVEYVCAIKMVINSGKYTTTDFSKYDIIHFHHTLLYYLCRNDLKNYKGKVILTSHSPMPFFKEYMEDHWINKNLNFLLEKIDIYAFNNADYILFPCKEAEECYYNQWDKYKKLHENNKKKYVYLPTWLIPVNIKESKQDLRIKYSIDDNYFVLCYVGRHNEVKWYDNLRELGQNYLEKNKNANFLIAWKEEPLKWLNNERWREIWRTNKPYEIIKVSDVFILPNKETYFDLILLEVLSLWKPIVLTRTWWNKYFEKFKDSGLFFYDYNNQEEFNFILDKLSHEDLDEIGMKNRKIFEEYFSSDKFATNYVQLYKGIIS